MTTATLGWFIAGICVASFVFLWFSISYKELSEKRKRVDESGEQLQMHRTLYLQECGGEHDAAARNILENRLMAYRYVAKEYNTLLKKTLNRIPGYMMGFRPAPDGGEL